MCRSVVGIEMKAQTGSKQLVLEGGTILNPPMELSHGLGGSWVLRKAFAPSPLDGMGGNDFACC